MDEAEGYDLLSGIGIRTPPYVVVTDADDAAAAQERIGGPVVMKVLSPDLAHKSDVGGVQLNLGDAESTRRSYASMMKRVSEAAPDADLRGALVLPQKHNFTEIVIGAKTDPQLGACVMVGLGGIFVELIKDVSVRPAPVDAETAHEMLRDLKAFPLLTGARGAAPRDIDAIVEAVVALSQFAAANGDWLESIEINPFASSSTPGESCALDCAVTPKPKEA